MKHFTFLSSKKPSRFFGESRGFTVTELLVVVAIIALLLALVLVGFRKAKLMAKRCLAFPISGRFRWLRQVMPPTTEGRIQAIGRLVLRKQMKFLSRSATRAVHFRF